jgi:hypothetical protein
MINRTEFTDLGKNLIQYFSLKFDWEETITSRTPSQGVADCLGPTDYNLRVTALANSTFSVPLVTTE